MAKKRGGKMPGLREAEKIKKPVRLDLTEGDHELLMRLARKKGLTMSALVRMTLLEWLDKQQEAGK